MPHFSELLAANLDDDARLLYVMMTADIEHAAGLARPGWSPTVCRTLLLALVAAPEAKDACWREVYRQIGVVVASSAEDANPGRARLMQFLQENLELADPSAFEMPDWLFSVRQIARNVTIDSARLFPTEASRTQSRYLRDWRRDGAGARFTDRRFSRRQRIVELGIRNQSRSRHDRIRSARVVSARSRCEAEPSDRCDQPRVPRRHARLAAVRANGRQTARLVFRCSIAASTVVFAATFSSFVWWERFGTKTPIVDLRILANRSVATGIILSAAIGIAAFGSSYTMPQLTQGTLGFTPSLSGFLFLVRAFPIMLATLPLVFLASRIDTRFWSASAFSSWACRAPS